MATAQDVLDILADQHPEFAFGSGKVDSIWLNVFFNHGGTAQQAADLIWEKVQQAPYSDIETKVWRTFGGAGHMWTKELSEALGLQLPDVAYDQMPGARTAEDAISLALAGWYWHGEARFLDLTSEYGKAEFAKRNTFAKSLPPSWEGVDPKVYWLLVMQGDVRVEPRPLGSEQSPEPKRLRGLSLQQWLDNQWAIRAGKVVPWSVK